MKAFQSLFPPLSPHTISLSSARRIVLVAYNEDRGTIDFRHYLIRVKAHGVSRRVRKVLDSAASSSKPILNLGNERDVADFVLRSRGMPGPDGGYESASSAESAVEDGDMVSLAGDYVGRNNRKGNKRAVKLEEVGPRMELRLVKIAEGIPGKEGNVIYHEFGESLRSWKWTIFLICDAVKKTKKEVAAQKAAVAEKEKLRRQRREEQERNVARKKKLAKGDDAGAGDEGSEGEGEGIEDEEDDGLGEWDDEEEISEGEDSEEEADDLSAEESSDEEDQPPAKKPKFHRKRWYY
jgi:ribosome biogenesis protein SSF1/2